MRIFKTRTFSKWAVSEDLSDKGLTAAINEIEQGLVDAKLGGGLYKKRVAIGIKGKSGGLRTLIALRHKDKAFFIYGFVKSQRTNISGREKPH